MRRRIAVGAAVLAWMTVAGPAHAETLVTVSPNTNLYDGQVVVVKASGFTGDDRVILHECVRTPSKTLLCDYRKRTESDREGRVAGAAFHVFSSVQGQPCNATTRCFVRAKDTHGTVARATLSFKGA